MRSIFRAAALACVVAGVAYGQDGGPRDPLAPDGPGLAGPSGEGPPAAAPPQDDVGELRREMERMRERLATLERRVDDGGGDAGPHDEPGVGDALWSYARENLRLSLTLNTFYVYRDHSALSANGPTGGASAFSVGQLELDIWSEHRFGVDFRVDVDTTEDDTGLGGNGTFNYPDDLQLEQAFLQVDFARLLDGPPVRVMFGKFNAPVGFEPIDAPGLWQFSRSNLAALLTPANLVGAKAGFFSEHVDVEAFVANAWNLNDDPDQEKTGGGRLVVRLLGEPDRPLLSIAPSVIFGHEPTGAKAGSRRIVGDLVLVARPIDRLAVAVETNFGHESDPVERSPLGGGPPILVGDHATWEAYLASATFRVTEWLGLTLRGEYIKDNHGFQTGAVRQLGVVRSNHLKSFTVALLFKIPLGDGEVFDPLFINVEYRYDRSNHELYTGRSPSGLGDETHASQVAFQVFFYF